MDVEVGVNIVDLGLVYKVVVSGDRAGVDITTTSPSCPVHVSMAEEVRQVILRKVPSLSEVEVQVVRDPPWTPERMSRGGKEASGWELTPIVTFIYPGNDIFCAEAQGKELTKSITRR